MNIATQIEYWRTGAQEDWDVGADLVTRGKTRHGLFFLHKGVYEWLLKL